VGHSVLHTDNMKCKDRRIYVTPVRTDMQSLCANRSTVFIADAKLQLTFTVQRNAHSSYGVIIVVAKYINWVLVLFVCNPYTEIQKSSETDHRRYIRGSSNIITSIRKCT
jgi:hypothetical protein